MPKSIVTLLLATVVVLAGVKLLVVLLEPRLAFFPVRGLDVTPRDFGIDFEELELKTADGETLVLWAMLHPHPRAEVLYFHGNGGNLSIWAPVLAGVQARGFTVVALDYRGYGKSSGAASESGLYRDTEAAVRRFWKSQHREQAPVIYWGRSLGATMAAYAATVEAPDGLVLESGFPDKASLLESFPPWLRALGLFSRYRLPTAAFLREVPRPVLVLHGDADTVIPFEQGRRLFERLGTEKRFYRIPGGEHNDTQPRDPVAYWRAVDELLGLAARPLSR
jgi:fermentation-respiration switch protein FrsA (DUF1100 family)